MPAQMTIDQAGLPAGVAGRARTDGLATGALVTVTNTGTASTTRVRLLWVPPEDSTVLASLTQTGPNTWTFAPQAARYGTYRIELTTDLGLPTQDTQIRVFGIRMPLSGLLIPAANEVADALASLANNTPTVIAASENNEAFSPFLTGSAFGWWKAMRDALARQEVDAAAIAALTAQVNALGTPLWAWNRTDLTQFVTTPVKTATETVNTLAFRADAADQFGPGIQMNGTWVSGGLGIYRLQPGQFTIPASGRCIVEIEISLIEPNGGAVYPGVFFHNDQSAIGNLWGYGMGYEGTSSYAVPVRCEGAYVSPSYTPAFAFVNTVPVANTPPRAGSRFLVELIQKQGSGAGVPPRPQISSSTNFGRSSGNSTLRCVPGDGLTSDSFAAPVAGWNTKTITSFGIGVFSVAAGAFQTEITDIRILPHPLG